MAIYTELSADEIAEVLAAYGLPPPERAVPEPKGYVNTNHHVWSGGRRFFLRLAEASTDADVVFEAEVHAYLAAAHFPAPRLLRTSSGAPAARARGKSAL